MALKGTQLTNEEAFLNKIYIYINVLLKILQFLLLFGFIFKIDEFLGKSGFFLINNISGKIIIEQIFIKLQ